MAKVLRPKEAWRRLGVGRTKFYEDFVATGRVRLIELGPRAKGALEDELDALIEEMRAARDANKSRKELQPA